MSCDYDAQLYTAPQSRFPDSPTLWPPPHLLTSTCPPHDRTPLYVLLASLRCDWPPCLRVPMHAASDMSCNTMSCPCNHYRDCELCCPAAVVRSLAQRPRLALQNQPEGPRSLEIWQRVPALVMRGRRRGHDSRLFRAPGGAGGVGRAGSPRLPVRVSRTRYSISQKRPVNVDFSFAPRRGGAAGAPPGQRVACLWPDAPGTHSTGTGACTSNATAASDHRLRELHKPVQHHMRCSRGASIAAHASPVSRSLTHGELELKLGNPIVTIVAVIV